jgi:hypothetical protein
LCRDIPFKHPANTDFEVLTEVTMKSKVLWLINAVYFRHPNVPEKHIISIFTL